MKKTIRKNGVGIFFLLTAAFCFSVFSSSVFAQEEWKIWHRDTPVEETKLWTITFNQPIDPSSVNEETVYIENEHSERIPLQKTTSADLRSIKVSPLYGKYQAGERYTLFVRRILSKEKIKVQKSAVKMSFKILKAAPVPHHYPKQKQEMLDLMNLERAKVGAAPLIFCEEVFDYADLRAREIAEKFSHTRPDGTMPQDAVSLYWVGENIAGGRATAEATMQQLMNSPGHRDNILNPDYTKIAIGYHHDPNSRYRYYWVQLFLIPR